MYNRYSSLNTSFTIFRTVVILLDDVSIYFRLISATEVSPWPCSSLTDGVFFNSTPAENTVFELNNCFVFHQTWAIDVQSILEFEQLIHDFLDSDNIVRWRVYIFSVLQKCTVFSYRSVSVTEQFAHSASVPLLRIRERVQIPWNSGSFWSLISSSQLRLHVP